MIAARQLKTFQVAANRPLKLSRIPSLWYPEALSDMDSEEREKRLETTLEDTLSALRKQQRLLSAGSEWSVVLVLQGMDASGKDGIVRHVMSGLNPQGCRVYALGTPTSEEWKHDFLWRVTRMLPARGEMTVFNRSHYEEVLIARVHPQLLDKQRLPKECRGSRMWLDRFDSINSFERHLVRSGTIVRKCFLHISRTEQKRRFLERLERPEKHWKFAAADLVERRYWAQYQAAYEDAMRHTSTAWAPWHVVPADSKAVARLMVARVLLDALTALKMTYPQPAAEEIRRMADARKELMRNQR
jgi:PPK2 family polyphosphate:nucleotide phosphotransferase